MNRLTPEIVAAAFEQIGAVPAQMMFGPGPYRDSLQPLDQCCGLYAAAAARGLPARRTLDQSQYEYLGRIAGLSEPYARGFCWGWDNDQGRPGDAHLKDVQAGMLDGRAAWLAVGEGKEARRA